MSVMLTDRYSIQQVLQEMTLEEKLSLLIGQTSLNTAAIPRLGIPSALVLDGCTGVNLSQFFGYIQRRVFNRKDAAGNALTPGMPTHPIADHILRKINEPEQMNDEERRVYQLICEEMSIINPRWKMPGCFPTGMMMGATWDPDVVKECARVLAREMDCFQVDMVLGSPNINIHRDPLNGRLFEGYSEDPCLTAKLAPAFVAGIQEEGLVANIKHFAANNQETQRLGINEIISMRALYEIYLPGFKACVQEGRAKSVMCAYNSINGVPCAQNHWLLTEVLRGEWGFEGVVVSDWGAVQDQAASITAGNDLEMPGPRALGPLLEAVEQGRLTMESIDLSVVRMLEMLTEMPVMNGRRSAEINIEESRKAAYRAAAEGMVLLKNDGVLPLAENGRVSFFGRGSVRFVESGDGSAHVYTDRSTSLLEEAGRITGAEKITFGHIAAGADTVVITAIASGQEGRDRPYMDLDSEEKDMMLRSIEQAEAQSKKIILILNVSGPVDMSEYIDRVHAVLCVFFPGMEGGRAAADILFGRLNPSGKLPLTFPKRYKDCPTYGNFPGCAGEVMYGEGVFVGYRYYEYKDVAPLFPFGYGLSYSQFEISGLRCSDTILDMDHGDGLRVSVSVTNLSQIPGREVVQLYLADPVSTLVKPVKELKAFQKVALDAGESKTVTFRLTKRELESYDSSLGQWVAEAGRYDVLIGNSSDHISVKGTFVAKGRSAYSLNRKSPLRAVCENPQARELLLELFDELKLSENALEGPMTFMPDYPVEDTLRMVVAPRFTQPELTETSLDMFFNKLTALGG